MNGIPRLRTFVLVWLSLLVLLALSTGSSYLHLGIANTLINMVIAAVKVGLIAVFFMHLRQADAAVRLAAGAALLFLFFLAFLSFADLLTRSFRAAPWQPPAETRGGPIMGSGYR
jgi:cytochrome c oxidase subunit IV